MSPGPLDGVRIVSLAEQYPGPYATMLMADLGADVILVERPDGGDPARQFPALFDAFNRGKRSVALDLKSPPERARFMELAATADVVLEGFRPGTVKRLGIDYESVRGHRPDIVYVSLSGFGQAGPHRDAPGHDVCYQAFAGLLADRIGGPQPPAPELLIGDLSAGLFATIATLAGLAQRYRDGVGTYVDVSMVDGLISLLTTSLVPLMNGEPQQGVPDEPGYGTFTAQDGEALALGIAHEDRFWAAFCRCAELEDMIALTAQERRRSADQLRQRIAAQIATRRRSYWLDRLAAAGVPVAPVNDFAGLLEEEHLAARGLVVGSIDDNGAARRYLRQPLAFQGHVLLTVGPTPGLGEHNADVLEPLAPGRGTPQSINHQHQRGGDARTRS